MLTYAHNVRRLMARNGMTLRDLVKATGLHERTIKAALNGRGKPQARTLHRLAAGLGVATDELFQNASTLSFRQFDRHTNPAIDELVRAQPDLFRDWTDADFDELCSHFGTGGELTPEGADLAPKFDPLGMQEKQGFQRGLAPAEKFANSIGDRSPKALWGRFRL